MRFVAVRLCVFGLLLIFLSVSQGRAASFREQRDQLKSAETYLKAAERLARADRAEDAKQAFAQARELVRGVGSQLEEKAARAYERTVERLTKTHEKLTGQGVSLDPLGDLQPAMTTGGNERPGAGGRFDPSLVSFVGQVAPILVAKCGNCHVDASRGEFSVASYNALRKGTPDGRVLVPGEGTGGVMMDLIESGDMPRGGLTVTPREMTVLAKWITQGAKFDGDNPDANLKQLKQGAAPAAGPEPEMKSPEAARPTGDETVSFALDVAPILMDRCNNCHVLDNRGNLRFASFQQLLRSGIVTPGKPDQSTLVRRLTGDETPRMPMNAPPLPEAEIEKIATWIKEGAHFDGASDADSLTRTTAVVRADKATPEELSAMRVQATADNWRLALPDERMTTAETDRFLVAGSIPSTRLKSIGQAAEAAADVVQGLLGGKPGESLGKSRVTLFAFDQRIDYGEFAQMVEKRQLPKGVHGHTRPDPVDPYACVLIDPSADELDAVSLTQQVATLYLSESTGGRAPDWFAEGVGRVAAAKTAPKAEEVESWDDQFESTLKAMRDADAFMSPGMPADAAGVIRYQYVKAMMRNAKAFDRLLAAVRGGESFDAAFAKQYKASPKDIAEQWRASLLRGRSQR